MSPIAAVQTNSRQKQHQSIVPYHDRLVTRKQLSEWLGIGTDRLSTWAKLGQGPPALRIGRKRAYKVGDVLEWLEKQAVSASSEAQG
jgi:predicted DNA-binding transcriptional regulator AlpA